MARRHPMSLAARGRHRPADVLVDPMRVRVSSTALDRTNPRRATTASTDRKGGAREESATGPQRRKVPHWTFLLRLNPPHGLGSGCPFGTCAPVEGRVEVAERPILCLWFAFPLHPASPFFSRCVTSCASSDLLSPSVLSICSAFFSCHAMRRAVVDLTAASLTPPTQSLAPASAPAPAPTGSARSVVVVDAEGLLPSLSFPETPPPLSPILSFYSSASSSSSSSSSSSAASSSASSSSSSPFRARSSNVTTKAPAASPPPSRIHPSPAPEPIHTAVSAHAPASTIHEPLETDTVPSSRVRMRRARQRSLASSHSLVDPFQAGTEGRVDITDSKGDKAGAGHVVDETFDGIVRELCQENVQSILHVMTSMQHRILHARNVAGLDVLDHVLTSIHDFLHAPGPPPVDPPPDPDPIPFVKGRVPDTHAHLPSRSRPVPVLASAAVSAGPAPGHGPAAGPRSRSRPWA
jgi:hypothetical protein